LTNLDKNKKIVYNKITRDYEKKAQKIQKAHAFQRKNMDKSIKSYEIQADSLHIIEKTDSTNLLAKRYAREMAPRCAHLFIAREQTAGRGRLGKSFVSVSGAGIYMSLLLPRALCKCEHLTPHAAVLAAELIDAEYGLKTKIKWVNDIYLGGKKLCGILCESVTAESGEITHFVIGLGINVYKNAITDEISDIATSLEHNGISVRYPDDFSLKLAQKILFGLSGEYDEAALLSAYRERSLLSGARVTVMPVSGEEYTAEVLGISDAFTLLVKTEDGSVLALDSGDVKIKI
jgi:BirA family biotin operon repressor/biotin-[acetyl-CoA-carboxylase] ligase